jgi:hydrogenase/urease accessory protein HupE
MKNLLFVTCNLAAVLFVMTFVFALANCLFGLHLGFKGVKVPGNPLAVVAFLAVAGIFGGVTYFLNRNISSEE